MENHTPSVVIPSSSAKSIKGTRRARFAGIVNRSPDSFNDWMAVRLARRQCAKWRPLNMSGLLDSGAAAVQSVMNQFLLLITLVTCWLGIVPEASAQATRGAPAGTIAQCADGSFSSDPRRPCVGRKGVQSQGGAGSTPVQPQLSPAFPASTPPPSNSRLQGSSIQGLPAGTTQMNSPNRR